MANCAGPNCGNGRPLPIDLLIEVYGADYEMVNETRIAKSCKCQRCGHKGARIHLIANHAPVGYREAKVR